MKPAPTFTSDRFGGSHRAFAQRPHLLEPARLEDHRQRLFRAAYALCGSRFDAEDLVQETFMRVIRRPRLVRSNDDLGYLLRVLRNTWISGHGAHERDRARVAFDDEVEYAAEPAADPTMTYLELKAAYDAVGELSRPLREAIVAVDILGLSYRQAARALDVRQGTIMSRLHRARRAVADSVAEAESE